MSSEINLEMGNSDNKQNPEKAPEKKHTVLKFLFVFACLAPLSPVWRGMGCTAGL